MIIYVLISARNESLEPVVDTAYFLDEDDARREFDQMIDEVGDDYKSITLEMIDTSSVPLEPKTIDYWYGDEEDLDDVEEDK